MQIWSKLSHQGIVKLRASFLDSKRLYFLMDYMPNSTLRNLLTNHRTVPHTNALDTLTCEMARKYLAQLIVVLDYLHMKKVAHRDLKPENLLLDSNKHIKLADFGSAIEIGIDSESKEAGTQNYAAPELLLGKGGKAADLWSLGCILFEMLTGKVPFIATGVFALLEHIEKGTVTFSKKVPELAKDLCLALLKVKESERLGFNGMHEVKTHPFFGGIDFDKVYSEPIDYTREENYAIISNINVIEEYVEKPYCPSSEKVVKEGVLSVKRGLSYREELVKLMENGRIKYNNKKAEVLLSCYNRLKSTYPQPKLEGKPVCLL
eukprot:TRINITY_DN7058_c0_g1_i19.p1 TRINITY_DN7058_c0_g1~~TRINITY_DN7058_c0_g1_i19.p1  ORF type:complete len:320 (+),score=77.86 TRINITY_DN7058_c0_g1_i19:680-1639(+)